MKVLITGGTGTFGKALARALLEDKSCCSDLSKVIIFSRGENKQFQMKKEFAEYGNAISFFIGDVRDQMALDLAMKGVEVVYHAAALKHVPIGEEFPQEAVATNVNGIMNVMLVAEINKVSRVVNLSSDKAVYPINAYGMTKGLSEKVVAAHQGLTVGVSLRYGNVIASRGSVIPLFIEQYHTGKLLTVTNQNMTRFLLPIDQAIQLAIQCSMDKVSQGSVFVIKSPACTVKTLVEVITGEDYSENNVQEVGIRSGEKMHETLLTTEEVGCSIRRSNGGIDYYVVGQSPVEDLIHPEQNIIEFTSENTERYGRHQTKYLLEQLGII